MIHNIYKKILGAVFIVMMPWLMKASHTLSENIVKCGSIRQTAYLESICIQYNHGDYNPLARYYYFYVTRDDTYFKAVEVNSYRQHFTISAEEFNTAKKNVLDFIATQNQEVESNCSQPSQR